MVLKSYIKEYENIPMEQSLVKVNADNTWEWVNKEKTVADLKVGDECFSVNFGCGKVLDKNRGCILIEFANGGTGWYNIKGNSNCGGIYQELFISATQALEYAKNNWKEEE